MFCLPETSGNNLLVRRTKRLRKLTGNQNLRCEAELMGEGMSTGLLYVWFESFVIVFIDIYGFNLGEEGLAYLGILIGAFAILPPFFLYLYKILEPQFDDKGDLKPEKRLPPACVGAFMIPTCLFWVCSNTLLDPRMVTSVADSCYSLGGVREPTFIGSCLSLARPSSRWDQFCCSTRFSTTCPMLIRSTLRRYLRAMTS